MDSLHRGRSREVATCALARRASEERQQSLAIPRVPRNQNAQQLESGGEQQQTSTTSVTEWRLGERGKQESSTGSSSKTASSLPPPPLTLTQTVVESRACPTLPLKHAMDGDLSLSISISTMEDSVDCPRTSNTSCASSPPLSTPGDSDSSDPTTPPLSLEDQVHLAYALEDMQTAKILLLKLQGINITCMDDPRIGQVKDEDFDVCFLPNGGIGLDEGDWRVVREMQEKERLKERERERERRRRERLGVCERKFREGKRRAREERMRRELRKREEEEEEEERRIRRRHPSPSPSQTQRSRQVVNYDGLKPSAARKLPFVDPSSAFVYDVMPFSRPKSPYSSASQPSSAIQPPGSTSGYPSSMRQHSSTTLFDDTHSVPFADVLKSMHGPLFPREEEEPRARERSPQRGGGGRRLLFEALQMQGVVEDRKKTATTGRPTLRRRRTEGVCLACENNSNNSNNAGVGSGLLSLHRSFHSSSSSSSSSSSASSSSASTSASSSASAFSSSTSASTSTSSSSSSYTSTSTEITVPSPSSSPSPSPRSSWLFSRSKSWLGTSVASVPSPVVNAPSEVVHSCGGVGSVKLARVGVSLHDTPLGSNSHPNLNSDSGMAVDPTYQTRPQRMNGKTRMVVGLQTVRSRSSVPVFGEGVVRGVSRFVEIARGFQTSYVNIAMFGRDMYEAGRGFDDDDYEEEEAAERKSEKRRLRPAGYRVTKGDVGQFLSTRREEAIQDMSAVNEEAVKYYPLTCPSQRRSPSPSSSSSEDLDESPVIVVPHTTLPNPLPYQLYFKPVPKTSSSPFRIGHLAGQGLHTIPPTPSPSSSPFSHNDLGDGYVYEQPVVTIRMRCIGNPVFWRLKALGNVMWQRGFVWEGRVGASRLHYGQLDEGRHGAGAGAFGSGRERIVGVAFDGIGRSALRVEVKV